MPVAEGQLRGPQLIARAHERFRPVAGRQRGHVLRDPLGVRPPGGHLPLGGHVANDALTRCIHQEHTAGAEFAGLHDVARIEVHDADFGARHHHSVGADLVPARAQAVAVERHGHRHAVAEGEGGGPVPRFDHALVVLVERLHGRLHVGELLPRLRHQHHGGVHRGTP